MAELIFSISPLWFFRSSRRKTRRYTFLFFWIHFIIEWKKINCCNNRVQKIDCLQVSWSLVMFGICTIFCWIWNNVISWIALTTTPKLIIWSIWKRMYNPPITYSSLSKHYIVLQKKWRIRKNQISVPVICKLPILTKTSFCHGGIDILNFPYPSWKGVLFIHCVSSQSSAVIDLYYQKLVYANLQ